MPIDAGNAIYTIADLYDLSKTIAAPLFDGLRYPYEALADEIDDLKEALARGGVGKLTLVDHDRVSPSNLNRQVVALHSTVGRPKALAAHFVRGDFLHSF